MLKRRPWILVAAYTLFVLPFLVFGWFGGSIPSYAEYCYKDEYSGQKQCATYDIVTFSFLQIGKILHNNGEAVIAVFTVLIATGTWLLFRAARDLVRTAEETAQRQLRAYVSIEGHMSPEEHLKPILNRGGNSRIPLKVVNRGQTPAYRVKVWVRTQVASFPLTEILAKEPPPELTFSRMALGPGAHITIDALMKGPWPIGHYELLTSGKAGIYVFGKAWYRDAFERDQWTEFRMMLPLDSDGNYHGLQGSPEGNDAS